MVGAQHEPAIQVREPRRHGATTQRRTAMKESLRLLSISTTPMTRPWGSAACSPTPPPPASRRTCYQRPSASAAGRAHRPMTLAPGVLGAVRERELRAAARTLGVRSVTILGHMDGELDRVPAETIVPEIAGAIRRVRPHVVVTFGHDGFYGHPDHIAVSQFTSAAIAAAADPGFVSAAPPHGVSKLYHRAPSPAYVALYETAFGALVMEVDGIREARSRLG